MNWPFLFLALVGGLFPLAMIAWVLLLAPTGEAGADAVREQRRDRLGASLRRTLGRLADSLGALRAAGAARLARRANG